MPKAQATAAATVLKTDEENSNSKKEEARCKKARTARCMFREKVRVEWFQGRMASCIGERRLMKMVLVLNKGRDQEQMFEVKHDLRENEKVR